MKVSIWPGILIALAGAIIAASSAFAHDTTDIAPADSLIQLRHLVAEAIANSPAVKAAHDHWMAERETPIQAATPPDPELQFQQLTVGSPQPFSGYESSNFYYSGFGVSQDIPGPGKLALRKAEATDDVRFAKCQYEAVQRDVAEKVKEAYFELFYQAMTLALIDRNAEELHEIERIVETRYRVGESLQQDVIRAQIASIAILKDRALHDEERRRKQAELKQLLGRDPDSPDIAVGRIEPSRFTATSGSAALAGSPEVAAGRAMEHRGANALKLARRGYWPDFTVGYMYQKTGPGFRDYYMLTLGAKAPLYFWRKQTPAIEQAALEEQSARERRRAAELEASAGIDRAIAAMRAAERVMTIYRDGLIPQAETSEQSAMAAYRVGKADFETLLSAVLERQNLRQEYYRAIADHEIAVAQIERIAGDGQ